MNEPAEPRWECLPHDPTSFFDLNAGFQRTDLKRSYNRLIRKFKPEKAPQQFQRIRAAFEQLDNQLRYGKSGAALASVFSSNVKLASAVPMPGSSTDATDSKGRSHTDARTPARLTLGQQLAKRLETEAPVAIYLELRAAEPKTPEHYYALAVLSDVSEPKKQMFLRWLLSGLKKYPKEPAFQKLLQAYFRSPMPKELAVKVLPVVAGVVNGDAFYLLTEPLWLQLLGEIEFETYSKTLQVCEEKALSHQVNGRTVFYLQLLRNAMFLASEEWLDQVATSIEENHSVIPPYLESELEITMALLAYRRQMDLFRNGNPLRGQMHAAFVSYCGDDDAVAIRNFLECQSRISQNAGEALDAFPVDLDSELKSIRDAWQLVTFDIARRLWLETQSSDQDRYVQLILKNLSQLEQGETKRFWIGVRFGIPLTQALAIATAFGWSFVLLPVNSVICTILGSASIGLYLTFAFRRVSEYAQQKRSSKLEHAYRTRWRPAVQRMVIAANGDLGLVQGLFHHFTDDEYKLNVTPFLNGFVQHDLGLQILSDAKMFAN